MEKKPAHTATNAAARTWGSIFILQTNRNPRPLQKQIPREKRYAFGSKNTSVRNFFRA
jgi:hypothetical protein